MAEIPTFQAMQDAGLVAEPGHPSVAPWLARTVRALGRGLRLEVDGRGWPSRRAEGDHLPARCRRAADAEARRRLPGAPRCRARGELELRYVDENFPERTGWKEIVVRAGPGVTLAHSTAPATDRSRELADYPVDLVEQPTPGRRGAGDVHARGGRGRGRASAGAPAVARAGPGRQSSAGALADLVTRREPGAGLIATALLVAVVLGAFHALEPGHGKTVVAAYLVGSRGTARHALILGLVVTVSHTAGVYLLGGVTFYASQHIVPERLYPWLSLGSGLTIAGLGLVLFMRRLTGADTNHGHTHGHGHHHHHDHTHDHTHDHDHAHGHDDAHPADHAPVYDGAHAHDHHHHDQPVSLRALVALGVSGGIIPCPAALVVLLSALSIHRVGFGLVLIVAFSVGLAAVLVAIGILMVYAGRLMTRFREDGPLIHRWLPLTSSAVMTLLGLGIAAQAVAPWIPR